MECTARLLCLTLAATVSASFVPTVQAITTNWNNNIGGSFTDATKWAAGVPLVNDTAVFDRNLDIQYNVTFPGKATLPLPVYAIDQLRIGMNTVSFSDQIPAFGTAGTVNVNNATSAIVIGDTAGQTAILNTTLKSFSGLVATIGNAAGSSGTLNVNAGTFSITTSSALTTELYIGFSGAGALNVTGGAQVNLTGEIGDAVLGHNANSSGSVAVSGAGSTLAGSIYSDMFVGGTGTGTLNITNGGHVSNFQFSWIGYSAGSSGTATVEGANSIWSSGGLSVGFNGQGVLNVFNGGRVITEHGSVSGTATVDGAGSTWTSTYDLSVDGILDITDRGTASSDFGYIGLAPLDNGTVTVDGAGSTWTTSDYFRVGNSGSGTLTIRNGGRVTNGSAIMGYASDGEGTVVVDGAGSTWSVIKDLTVGERGIGSSSITNGGQVSSTNGYIGRDNSTLTDDNVLIASIDGAGSMWTNSGDLWVGNGNRIANGHPTLVVSNGGTVAVSGLLYVESRGIVRGNGNITADVVNAGLVAPGMSPGALHIDGIFLQSAAGKLQIELGGTTPGNNYDQLLVSGAVSLSGTLQVSLVNAFMPAADNTFNIIDGSTIAGTFSSLDLPMLGGGLTWNTSQLYTNGVLSVSAGLAGDYNHNGVVDAADYTVWRDTLGSTTNLAADGNGNNAIDAGDRTVWRANFGRALGSGANEANAVPEPVTHVLFALDGIFAICIFVRRKAARTG